MKKGFYLCVSIGLIAMNLMAQVIDAPFKQAVSVKYTLPDELKDAQLKKVVIDYNEIVYVLTDKGLYRDYNENELSKDLFYRLLAKKIPVDITVQEETGYLYYLYADEFLTNAHAGTIYKYFPKNEYQRILVNENGQVLLLGSKKTTLYQRTQKLSDYKVPKGDFVDAYVHDKKFYYLTSDAIYSLENGDWKTLHKGKGMTAITFRHNEIFVGTKDGFYAVDIYRGQVVLEKNNKLPAPQITDIRQIGNQLWFGSENGTFLQEQDRYRYFSGRRWLDQNKVIDIANDGKGDLYFLTPTGLNKVKYITQTLAEKTKKIEDDIRKYHMRFGWVNEIRYSKPGAMQSAHSEDNDNDGLWTSLYLGSQAFKYATTGEELAKRYVWESFESFERLLT
ncbi:MAG: hypothetical protein KAJ23_16715, partial [Maribacter sp.]|nr:hypothetical protein [Maribacter sp.]